MSAEARRDPMKSSLDDLAEGAAEARLEGHRTSDVIAAAARALVAGLDSPSLRDLAGRPPLSTWRDTESLVHDTLAELGDVDWWGDDQRVGLGALRAACRRFDQGEESWRELVEFVRRASRDDRGVGAERRQLLQIYYDFDYLSDFRGATGRSISPHEEAAFAERTRDEAHLFMSASEGWRVNSAVEVTSAAAVGSQAAVGSGTAVGSGAAASTGAATGSGMAADQGAAASGVASRPSTRGGRRRWSWLPRRRTHRP